MPDGNTQFHRQMIRLLKCGICAPDGNCGPSAVIEVMLQVWQLHPTVSKLSLHRMIRL